MTNYNKMTVQDFRKKLKNGAYESATAARRGIGKMQGWSDAERDTARGAVAKHFGDEAPAKKTAAKAKGGKASKKAVKKQAAKAKSGAKTKAKAKSGGKKRAASAAPAAAAEPAKAAPRRSTAEAGSAVLDATIARYEKTVGIYKTAADALAQTGEGIDRKEALDNIADGLTRLMSRMTTEVVEPLEGKAAVSTPPPAPLPAPVVAAPREVAPAPVAPATPALAAPAPSNGIHEDALPEYSPPPAVGVVPPQI